MDSLHQYIMRIAVAREYLEDALRENLKPIFYSKFKNHLNKLNFLINDVRFSAHIPDSYKEWLKYDLSSDLLTSESILEKLGKLSPKQRVAFEELLDKVISGEKIEIVYESKQSLPESNYGVN